MTRPAAARRLSPLAVLALVLSPWPVDAGLDGGRIGWSELHYRTRKLGFSVESRVRLQRLSRAELQPMLVDPGPGDWLPAPERGGWWIQLESHGFGRGSRVDLLIDADGRSLQRTQVETGRRLKDNRNRTHRFSVSEIHVDTRKPGADEVDEALASWSEHSEGQHGIPDGLPDDAALGQSSGLFYVLAAADLSRPGDRVVTHVLSKGQVTEVELVVEARELIEADFVAEGGAGSARRDGRIETLRVRVAGHRTGPGDGSSDFRFLGLRDDVVVYLDVATRAPVLITGDVGWLGTARIRLERLVLGRR